LLRKTLWYPRSLDRSQYRSLLYVSSLFFVLPQRVFFPSSHSPISLSLSLLFSLTDSSVLCNYIVFRTDWDREVLRAQDRLGLGAGKQEEERRPLLVNEEITEEGEGEEEEESVVVAAATAEARF